MGKMERIEAQDAPFDYVVGIDEAGRGPLAGPLAVGAVRVNFSQYLQSSGLLAEVPAGRDSKKMTEREREFWYQELEIASQQGLVRSAVAYSTNGYIDKFGLAQAARRAVADVLKKLDANPERTLVLLDAGLGAPPKYKYQESIVRGDESEVVIALASVWAKVSRDHKMLKEAARFPEYGFDRHKGYGTAKHKAMISSYGPTEIHRLSFLGLTNIKKG
jgi:ribonuclease HII